MRICEHWPKDPPSLNFERPHLNGFNFKADLDPALQIWIQNPASKRQEKLQKSRNFQMFNFFVGFVCFPDLGPERLVQLVKKTCFLTTCSLTWYRRERAASDRRRGGRTPSREGGGHPSPAGAADVLSSWQQKEKWPWLLLSSVGVGDPWHVGADPDPRIRASD
jgi:hypothetical protein